MAKSKKKRSAFSRRLCAAESALPLLKMTEEEVAMEVEAVEAVYGDDCVILDSYPPHLHLHIKPRTAEISSQQVFFSVFF